jgi:signal transduction histidine kinase
VSAVPATGFTARWRSLRARCHAGQHRWRHSMRHSLKWRLVIVFLMLALALTGVFMIGMKRVVQAGWTAYAKPMVADYVDKLTAEIGSPPSVERVRAITERLPVTVRIEGPLVQHDSHPGMRQHRPWARHYDEDEPDRWGYERRTADGHRITYGLTDPLVNGQPRRMGWVTLAALLALTVAAFAYVRRMLRPLQQINEGVARFGAGDFSQPITHVRRDELGDLAERVNGMATSLHGMLEAKRALLLAISHELRSPLTRARVNAELVGESEHRDALLRDLGEMRDLISDLLEGERLTTGHAALHTERVQLAALVRELVATQFADATLTLNLDDSIGAVLADAMRLKLLLRNLIDNALRHSAGAALPPVVSLQRAEAGRIALGVRDFGPGVTEEQLQRLSEPFYRADSARTRATGGVGLGLYLCRLIAQAHGGELRITRADPGLHVQALIKP